MLLELRLQDESEIKLHETVDNQKCNCITFPTCIIPKHIT